MTTETLTVGTKVEYPETYKGAKWVKIGEVVEVGELDRVRVRWSHWLYEGGHIKQDGKRTWVRSDRLKVSS
jgi:hypothetical protein